MKERKIEGGERESKRVRKQTWTGQYALFHMKHN